MKKFRPSLMAILAFFVLASCKSDEEKFLEVCPEKISPKPGVSYVVAPCECANRIAQAEMNDEQIKWFYRLFTEPDATAVELRREIEQKPITGAALAEAIQKVGFLTDFVCVQRRQNRPGFSD